MQYRSKVAGVFLAGFFLDLVNMFIAGVAYPAIGQALQAPVSGLAWVSNGYICGLTLAIPLSAWLTQRFGARRVFVLSLLLFMAATLASGCAGTLGELVAWRILQGAGGGLLIPVGQALTWQLYPPHQRARLASVVMLVALLAPALSPTLGGLLVQALNWRWVFFASLPLAAVTLLLALCWLRQEPPAPEHAPLDLPGLLGGCSGLLLVLLAMTRLSEADGAGGGLALLLAGLGLLAGFVRRCRRHPTPLFSVALLSEPLLRFSMGVYQCVPGLFMGVSLLAMLWLQTVVGLSAAQCGMLMIPWSLASGLAIATTGRTFNRLGPRPPIVAGCLLQAAGIVLLAQVTAAHPFPQLIAAFTLMGLGGSLCSSTAQSSAFLQIPAAELPQASALWNINRQLSFCFGVALLSLLQNLLIGHLAARPAWAFTFYTAAAGSLIPALLSGRINNRAVKQQLLNEENA
ncbi:MFS transporter [Erwinia sp. E602]|uniref:MFS transporter n=1 Tax=Erwinia sp. E602 TaxID=2675378 RepID=UPI001BA94EDC|nr:MFS transporter [Erwinia sp. E602]QUG77766.1 MFS transporter [Erwinia sp. E602]